MIRLASGWNIPEPDQYRNSGAKLIDTPCSAATMYINGELTRLAQFALSSIVTFSISYPFLAITVNS